MTKEEMADEAAIFFWNKHVPNDCDRADRHSFQKGAEFGWDARAALDHSEAYLEGSAEWEEEARQAMLALKEAQAEIKRLQEDSGEQTSYGLTLWDSIRSLTAKVAAADGRTALALSALKRLGLQCVNTGQYGPMKIRPGECTCSTCGARRVIEYLEDKTNEVPYPILATDGLHRP